MKIKLKQQLVMFLACMFITGIGLPGNIFAEAAETEEDSLTVEEYSPYSIKNEGVLYGDSLTLQVNASSTVSDVFYQWQSGPSENEAEDIAGATDACYTITAADTDTPKFFQCLVWDDNHTEDKLKKRYNIRVDTILLPDRTTDESRSYYIHAWEGNEIVLSPEAESPFEMTYGWKYYDTEESKWIDMEQETKEDYKLSYTESSPDRYQCRIQNAYSSKTITYYLTRHSADDPEPVKMELSPTVRDWYIYEQTGENMMSLSSYSNQWPGKNGAIKITYKDGTESYISSNYSQSSTTVIQKKEDGTWKAGDYQIVYGYMNVSTVLNLHIVRIGENGSDLSLGTAAEKQTAGNNAKEYQYYRIRPETSGIYEVNISNVSGSGKVGLYPGNEANGSILRLYFDPLEELAFSDVEDKKMSCTLEGGVDYFLVVQSDGTQVGFDILFDKFTREIPLDTPVSVDGIKEFTFTPEKSGYYTLEYLSNWDGETYYTANAEVYTWDMDQAGKLNSNSALYMSSGSKYNIVLSSNYSGVPDYETVRLGMVSEAQHSEHIMQAALSGGLTVTLDDAGLLTYKKTEEGMSGNVISETRDGQYGVLTDNNLVKTIVIGEGIQKLEYNTFNSYANLLEVTLPASLEEIGRRAFADCTKLATVNLPSQNSLTSVGEEAFLSTPFLNDQTGNYVMLGTIVLKYKGEERETLIPEESTALAGSAMRFSNTLEKITILDKLKQIGEFSIADCTGLSDIDVPGNVTDISYCAFYQDTALEQVVLNEGVERVGSEAFFGCTKLKEIYIPKSVSYIGPHAIGYADWSWSSYTYNLSEELPTIYCYYRSAGYNYAKNNQLPYVILDEKDLGNQEICALSYSYSGKVWPVRLNTLTVKFADETLREGTDYSVSYQDAADKSKTTVVITGMGDYFGTRSAELLSSLSNGEENQDKDKNDPSQNESQDKDKNDPSQNGSQDKNSSGSESGTLKAGTVITEPGTKVSYKVTQSGAGKATVEFSKAPRTMKGTVKIPATIKLNGENYQVTAIGASAFANNKQIKKVQIGNNVKTIGNNAFSGCSKITAISGGSNVVSIGNNAFLKCTALKKFTISKNISKIGKKAFANCKNLKTITIKSTKLTKKTIGNSAFSGTPSNAKVSVPKNKLKAYKSLLKSKGISKKAKIK